MRCTGIYEDVKLKCVSELFLQNQSGMLSPHGRQPKKAKITEETPSNGTLAASPLVAAQVISSISVKHGRGRPTMVRPI